MLSTLLLTSAPHPSPAADTADSVAARPPYRLRITACYRHKMPLNAMSGSCWEPADAGGIGLCLPTGVPRLSVQVRGDIATLSRTDGPSPDITLIELDLLAIWTGRLRSAPVGIDIAGGLTSAMVLVERPPTLGQPLFTASESEYGFQTAIEPFVAIRRWRFGLPLCLVWILSAPRRFVHVDVGVSAGWEL